MQQGYFTFSVFFYFSITFDIWNLPMGNAEHFVLRKIRLSKKIAVRVVAGLGYGDST